MNREQERIRKNLEKNPVAECNKIQKKSRKFNDEQIVENLYSFLGERKKEFLPHGVTENEFLEKLDSEELETI